MKKEDNGNDEAINEEGIKRLSSFHLGFSPAFLTPFFFLCFLGGLLFWALYKSSLGSGFALGLGLGEPPPEP